MQECKTPHQILNTGIISNAYAIPREILTIDDYEIVVRYFTNNKGVNSDIMETRSLTIVQFYNAKKSAFKNLSLTHTKFQLCIEHTSF